MPGVVEGRSNEVAVAHLVGGAEAHTERLSGLVAKRARPAGPPPPQRYDVLLGGELSDRAHGPPPSRRQSVGSRLVSDEHRFIVAEQARQLVGAWIAVSLADLPQAQTGEYYWIQLEGLEVRDMQGRALGRIEGLMETGANDVLIVGNGRIVLIPWTPLVVQRVDLDGGRVTVDWEPED